MTNLIVVLCETHIASVNILIYKTYTHKCVHTQVEGGMSPKYLKLHTTVSTNICGDFLEGLL